MYRLFWIDRESNNELKIFEDERIQTEFSTLYEGIEYLNSLLELRKKGR